jgi:hypothetical protein
MKFANKYELFEAVTSGTVETFFAKDLASGERVLLHIFEAPEKKPDQPTVQWVLESFRRVAPDPPGLVLETGRYNRTTYAFLVTKLPEDSALQRWIQSYQANGNETQEIASLSQDTSTKGATTKKEPPQPSERILERSTAGDKVSRPGEFTEGFLRPAPASSPLEANVPKQADWDEINSEPTPTAAHKEPGDFTRQFFSGSHKAPERPTTQASTKSHEADVHPGPEISPTGAQTTKTEDSKSAVRAPGGAPSTSSVPSPDAGSFTALFRSDFKAEPTAPSERVGVPPKIDEIKAGDFTDFFRGPFDGERPSETPNISSKPMEMPQRSAPGEFTMLFGPGKPGTVDPTPPLQEQFREISQKPEPGAFTKLFPGGNQPAASPPTNAEERTWEPTALKSEIRLSPTEPSSTQPLPLPKMPSATSSIERMLSKPAAGTTVRATEPPQPAGATHVFSAVGGRLPISTPLPSGPSEYTRVISGGKGEPLPSEASIAGGSLTPAPSIPKIAAPPPPKFSPPAPPTAPKAPQFESKPPKPKASYLPLIIILNVLLFFAILLIVYFAIKR